MSRTTVLQSRPLRPITWGDYVVIRHKAHEKLVLDGGDSTVLLKFYDASPQQIWKLSLGPLGRLFIANHLSDHMLSLPARPLSGARVTTSAHHGGLNQQWYINWDGTIVNAQGFLAVDIHDGRYISGTTVNAHTYHGTLNQQFTLTPYSQDQGTSANIEPPAEPSRGGAEKS